MEKPFNMYSTKSQGLEVKDLDEGSRKVSLYLSKFDASPASYQNQKGYDHGPFNRQRRYTPRSV